MNWGQSLDLSSLTNTKSAFRGTRSNGNPRPWRLIAFASVARVKMASSAPSSFCTLCCLAILFIFLPYLLTNTLCFICPLEFRCCFSFNGNQNIKSLLIAILCILLGPKQPPTLFDKRSNRNSTVPRLRRNCTDYSKEDCEKLSNLLVYVKDLPDACQKYPAAVKKVESKEKAMANPLAGTNSKHVASAQLKRRMTTTRKPLK